MTVSDGLILMTEAQPFSQEASRGRGRQVKARRKIINSENIVDGNVDYVCFINLNNSNL